MQIGAAIYEDRQIRKPPHQITAPIVGIVRRPWEPVILNISGCCLGHERDRQRADSGSNHAAVEKYVLVVNDRGRTGQNNGNRIEANLRPIKSGACDIAAGGPNDVLLLFLVNRTAGRAKFFRAARLYFDENGDAPAARHDVDFRILAGAIVPGNHRQPSATQVSMRQVLAAAPQSGFRS